MNPLATSRLGALVAALLVAGCASPAIVPSTEGMPSPTSGPAMSTTAPSPDLRVGLGDGLFDAEQALWNLDLVSATAPPEAFVGVTNSDLAFSGNYAFQGLSLIHI